MARTTGRKAGLSAPSKEFRTHLAGQRRPWLRSRPRKWAGHFLRPAALPDDAAGSPICIRDFCGRALALPAMTRTLITGCSTGIGRATAVELTKRGHEVVATARRPEVLDDLDVSMRLALDVTSDESVAAAVAAAGEIDVLVNNAGISVGGPVETVPIASAQEVFDMNVW